MLVKKFSNEDIQILVEYLKSVENDFNPPLFERIRDRSNVYNVEEYANKVLSNASILYAIYSNCICGIVIIYHNDLVTKKGYIPLLSVRKEFSGKGFAKNLVQNAIKIAFEDGMNEILVKTWKDNNSAKKIYENLGFMLIDSDTDLIFRKIK